MTEATLHQAKTTLSRLVAQAETGAEVVVCRYAAKSTKRLRLGNITNGPSCTEVQVFEEAYSHAPVVNLASDANGSFIGMVCDEWGSAPPVGAEVSLPGESYYGYGVNVGKINADGTTGSWPWAQLDTNSWSATGLHIDQTGVFGGDLIVVGCNLDDQSPPGNGGVWRIAGTNSPGTTITNRLAAPDTYLEGVLTCPNDTNKYGMDWAGKILVGGAYSNAVFAVDLTGNVSMTTLGFGPQDLHIIPGDQDFYCVDYHPKDEAPTILRKVHRDFFVNIADDFIMIQSGEWPQVGQWLRGHLYLVHWDGTAFLTMRITEDELRILEHGVFTPLSLAPEP